MPCDGIPEREHALDEHIDECKGTFPPGATYECNAPGISNTDLLFRIMSVPCNRIKECEGGIDEQDCQNNETIFIVALSCGMIVSVIVAIVVAYTILRNRKLEVASLPLPMSGTEEDEVKRILDIQRSDILERKRQNCEEFGVGLSKIHENHAIAVNIVKVYKLLSL